MTRATAIRRAMWRKSKMKANFALLSRDILENRRLISHLRRRVPDRFGGCHLEAFKDSERER